MKRLGAAALVLVIGCSGEAAPPPTEFDIIARDFTFDGDLWQPVDGTTVTVNVSNAGNTPHTWVVLDAGVAVASVDDVAAGDMLFEMNIPVGETASAQLAVPPPGDYQVICSIPGHLESGMEGRLSVQPAP